MFCPRCSNECDDNLLFCPKCGYKINSFTKKENTDNSIKTELFDEMIVTSSKQKEEEVETYISKDITTDNFKTQTARADFFDDDDDFEDEYIPPILMRNREKKSPSKTAPKQEPKPISKQVQKPAQKVAKKPVDKKQKNMRILLVAVIAVVAVILAVLITYFVKKGSMTKQFNKYYNQGNANYTEQKYRDAKTQFINAATNAFTDTQKIMAYEMIYEIDAILGGYVDEEIKYLELLIDLDPSNIEYYKNLIVLYQNNDMESKIEPLINSAPTSVKEALKDFDGTIPVASVEAGSYNKPIEIELTSMDDMTIHYTITDTGSGDVIEEQEYTSPILLEKEGKFTLSAYSVNSEGKESKSLTVKYDIDLTEVDPPVVNLESGTYTSRQKIKVTAQEGCTIYYTTTGVKPTTSSKKYEKAIKLPYGNSLYYFVAINEEGVASDVVTRAYIVSQEYSIKYNDALNKLSLALVSTGDFENKYGEFSNGDVAYLEYTGLEEIDNNPYYIITCNIETKSGSIKSTKIYAVSCDTGECYSATLTDGTSYSIGDL